jgi:hypothetical protein
MYFYDAIQMHIYLCMRDDIFIFYAMYITISVLH